VLSEKIDKIAISDKHYPRELKKIKGAPKVLYFLGKLKVEEPMVAIVGARNCSDYGKRATLQITSELCEAGITIVSGLAPGIDTYAHLATVEKNRRTIAVLGTGLNKQDIYPKENIGLAEKIIKTGGCLISEYPPGTRGAKFTFPRRNRIISGLSSAVLIVEGKEKSGSLITANWAFSQGKKVFAVPGQIYSQNSAGTNFLIKNGAKIAVCAKDILDELGMENLKITDKDVIDTQSIEEKLILNTLKENALHIDRIIENTKLNAQTIASILSILEIEGKIKNLGGNVYALIR
jgi:DNA processing protein